MHYPSTYRPSPLNIPTPTVHPHGPLRVATGKQREYPRNAMIEVQEKRRIQVRAPDETQVPGSWPTKFKGHRFQVSTSHMALDNQFFCFLKARGGDPQDCRLDSLDPLNFRGAQTHIQSQPPAAPFSGHLKGF